MFDNDVNVKKDTMDTLKRNDLSEKKENVLNEIANNDRTRSVSQNNQGKEEG